MRSQQLDSKCLDDPEHVLNDDQLWNELEHPDNSRRAAALSLVDALAELAALRAQRRRTSFLIERHRIFRVRSIIRDLRSEDVALVETAARAFTEAVLVSTAINAEKASPTSVIRRSADVLLEAGREEFADLGASSTLRKGAQKP